MTSLLFPDTGTRLALFPTGAQAANKQAVVYSNAAGTTLAEIYADNGGTPGALISNATITTDSNGQLPNFWGPVAGTDRLYISVNAGPVVIVDADYNARIDSVNAAVLNVKDFGAVGDAVTDDTTAVQAALTAAPTGSRVIFPAGKNFLCGGLAVNNKTDVIVDGNGSTITYKATGARIGLLLTGTCTNVTIQNLTVKGNATVLDAHCGMGFASGQTIVGAKFLNNRIVDCTLGITMQADASGTMRDCLVQGNHIERVVGTASGYGYGIHHANSSTLPDGTRIIGNTVRGAQRHSIYQAKGCGTVISGNTILDHRTGVADGSLYSAIIIGRSGDITVTGNSVSGGYDSAITIGGPGFSDGGLIGRNITVANNFFGNPLDSVPLMVIGQQAPNLDGGCDGFVVANNIFYTSLVGTLVQLHSGKRGRIENNVFECVAATGTSTAFRFAPLAETTGTALYTDDIVVADNTFFLAAGGTKFPINMGGGETVGSKLTVRGNTFTTPGNVFGTTTAITNPNMTVTGQPQTGINFAAGVGPLGQPVTQSRRTVADAAVTVAHADQVIAYTTLSAARVVTLPSAADGNGRQYTVKDESGSCSVTNTITITPASGTIDGAASLAINTAYGKAKVYSSGTNWFTA